MIHHLKSSPTFSVRPCSSVGRVTVDLFRRSWVRFSPRSKDFFFASCGSLFPFTRANAHWVIHGFKAPAKRSQHANATYRNIVGRNMLRSFGHLVAICWDVLGLVGSNLTSFKLEPTTANLSQHGGQTHATCCAQQCCDMLRGRVAIVWPGLK